MGLLHMQDNIHPFVLLGFLIGGAVSFPYESGNESHWFVIMCVNPLMNELLIVDSIVNVPWYLDFVLKSSSIVQFVRTILQKGSYT